MVLVAALVPATAAIAYDRRCSWTDLAQVGGGFPLVFRSPPTCLRKIVDRPYLGLCAGLAGAYGRSIGGRLLWFNLPLLSYNKQRP